MGLSWGFVGFVMRVLLVLSREFFVVFSWGFCWLCLEGFVGFVIRVMLCLP